MSGHNERTERWAQRQRAKLREEYEAFTDPAAQTVWLHEQAAELETEAASLLSWLFSSGRILTDPPTPTPKKRTRTRKR